MGRRGNGEGSVCKRKSDGRWLGVVFVGYGSNGRPVRKTVSGKTRGQVVEKLKTLQRHLDDGLPMPNTRLTVSALLTRWHDDVLRHHVSKSAADNYKSVADHHIVPMLGRKTLQGLTVADVNRLIATKMDQGLSVSTVRRIRSVLSQAIDEAIRNGDVVRNVAKLARPPKLEQPEGRTLTPEQARQLLDALKGHRLEAMYVTMLATGIRRGEALGLRWEDLNLNSGVLAVRRQLTREGDNLVVKDTKTVKSRRSVNLPSPVVAVLKAHKVRQAEERLAAGAAWQSSGHVFTTAIGTPIDPRNVYRDFQAVCERAGLDRWHPHELRHSAASIMLAQGVPLQVVSATLGHASIRMTSDVYGHLLEPQREAAAQAMENALWGS